jgi:hypothetical protein
VTGVLIFLVVMLGIFLYCYVRRPEMLFVFRVDWKTLFREGFSGLMARATEEAKARAEAKANDAAVGAIAGEEEDDEAAQGGAGKDGAALDDVPDGTEGAPGADTKKKKKTDLFATIGKFQGGFVAKLKTKLKIVLSVYQIQNALPWLLPSVSYPGAFEGLVNGMSFIELDFVRIVPMSCVFPYNNSTNSLDLRCSRWSWRRPFSSSARYLRGCARTKKRSGPPGPARTVGSCS